VRTGSGITGSSAGMKHDAFINPDWGAPDVPGLKPFKAEMPSGRLFTGETDGSSFPNGGLRITHQAAAFTSWDRGSPPMIYDGTCYIPCAFVSHYGAALDDKTPLLRSNGKIHVAVTFSSFLFYLMIKTSRRSFFLRVALHKHLFVNKGKTTTNAYLALSVCPKMRSTARVSACSRTWAATRT